MKQDAAVLDHDVKQDVHNHELSALRMVRNIPSMPLSAQGPAQSLHPATPGLGERVKGLFVSFVKGLEKFMEHDHEFDHWES